MPHTINRTSQPHVELLKSITNANWVPSVRLLELTDHANCTKQQCADQKTVLTFLHYNTSLLNTWRHVLRFIHILKNQFEARVKCDSL